MRFLTRYTPANPQKGPMNPEQMAKMGAFVQASLESGVLVATGGITPSATNRMKIKLSNGAYQVTTGSAAEAQQAGGWSILEVNSPAHLEEVARDFLKVFGDGDVQVTEITQMPIPAHRADHR
jgi:hypothetical protein